MSYWIKLVLENFSLVMFDIAVIMIVIHRLVVGNRIPPQEIIMTWLLFFGVGVTGIFVFIMQAFFPALTAETIGWHSSIFQAELAMANLAFGILGILSFRASFSFRLATIIGLSVFLFGDAIVHIQQIIIQNNFSRGNAGSWLWMDILIPILLILCLKKMKEQQSRLMS